QLAERGLALRRIHALYRLLVASLGQLGRLNAAAAAWESTERLGAANVERLWRVKNPYLNPADFEHFREGLEKAEIVEYRAQHHEGSRSFRRAMSGLGTSRR